MIPPTLPPVVLSLGMGVDSVALLVRWILEPDTRRRPDGTRFGLDELIVVTAMTGDEYSRTAWLMDTYLLPLLREHRVRYVQVARAGQSDRATMWVVERNRAVRRGYQVLDDSREPQRMHMHGTRWRLSHEKLNNGTVPQVASKRRWCSARAKAIPIDRWARDHVGDDYVHVIGFAAEEASRAVRAESYSLADQRMFSLIDWGWDRDRCVAYLLDVFGVVWQRSCCTYCPFQYNKTGIEQMVQRWRNDVPGAVLALTMEWRALAFNPKAMLFGKKTARSIALAHGLDDIVAAADEAIAAAPWALYRVRRIFRPGQDRWTKSRVVWRSTKTLVVGTSSEMTSLARRWTGEVDVDSLGVVRAYARRDRAPYPAVEDFHVAAPAGVIDKQRKGFETAWERVVAELADRPPVIQPVQLPLFAFAAEAR